jgi:hypothetical protein
MFSVVFAGERVCPCERDCFLLYTGFLAKETYGKPFLSVLEEGYLSLAGKQASRFGLLPEYDLTKKLTKILLNPASILESKMMETNTAFELLFDAKNLTK